jgi:nucleoside-diphosphate-sugar epimerase
MDAPVHTRPIDALITGFPRLLARGLVRRLTNEHPDSTARLLVPPDEWTAAEAFRDTLAEAAKARVVLVPGRVMDTDLGLPGPAVEDLLAHITHVFHAATLQTGPRGALRRHNVDATGRLLELAGEMRVLERFAFFSTSFVSGDRAGLIREEDLYAGQSFRTAFERTMAEAEAMLRDQMPRLPICVFRPSSMIGHSRTGEPDSLDDGPNYLVRLLVRLPAEIPLVLPGSGVVPLNIVPIDYVVRAAVAIARSPEADSRTFHLTDPNPLSARQAFEILSDLAHRPAPFAGNLAARAARGLLRLPGFDRLVPQQVALLEHLSTHVVYDCAGTLDMLARTDIFCPPFETYADHLVAWVARYEREHRAATAAERQPMTP